MKIQNLAVIFIIIILPISLTLSSYTKSQMQTLNLQISYDSKLNNATYDALKAFQLNTQNSSTSDIANSKLRDIEASINSFFNSLSSNFNMVGYNQSILKTFVPALVYTMYDGYYIYSPYNNDLTNLSEEEKNKLQSNTKATYHNGDRITGLKPYIHYSCRYVKGYTDVVITYSLDNYITVQGRVNNNPVYKYGYLLDNVQVNGENVSYRDFEIESEALTQFADADPLKNEVPYVKINGIKYYQDKFNDEPSKRNDWYSILNGEKINSDMRYKTNNEAAKQYYKEANNFSTWVKINLGNLTGADAVDENGQHTLTQRFGNKEIFDFGNKNDAIEDFDSDFNQHRLAVIRYSIEKNLSIAIANYNNYSGVQTNFQMPVLKEDEWTKIINNVSIISFMQGLNIGGKVYNGYSIITNTKNEEVVTDESIYLADNTNFYKPTDSSLNSIISYIGVLNIDFDRRIAFNDGTDITKYFFPKKQLASYSSIVNQFGENDIENNIYKNNIYKYIDSKGGNIAKSYYTALGRERYSMYKSHTNTDRRTFGTERKYEDDGLRAAYNQ